MQKIKIHEIERVVIDFTYETSDGEKWDSLDAAEDHQLRINGERITCDKCNGGGGYNDWQDEDGFKPKKMVFV